MSFLETIASAIKGGGEGRVPLARGFTSPWALAVGHASGIRPFDYGEAVRQSFLANPIAQRAVRIVAEGVGRAPLSISDQAVAGLISATSAGQSQKEFYINEAHALIDTLVHSSVQGVSSDPPAAPAEGDAWLAADPSNGDWAGFEHHLCTYCGGIWHFIAPRKGMTIFDEARGVRGHFDEIWTFADLPGLPVGGSTVDSEARGALTTLIEKLQEVGIFPRN